MIFWSSDLDSPLRVSMNAIFFKPVGNQIVKLMTIYVSKPTSLTPIWVEHFSDVSIRNLCNFGIQKMCRQVFLLHTPVFSTILKKCWIAELATHTVQLESHLRNVAAATGLTLENNDGQ